MQDEAGVDEKIIAVPCRASPAATRTCRTTPQLPEITLQQIEHFFAHYKDLEDRKWVKVLGWGDVDEAKKMILDGIDRAKAARAT